MDKEKYTNKQGYCPKCGGYNLNYCSAEFTDSMLYFPYECDDCGQVGEEWYSMEFAGHNIYDKNGEIIEL